MRSRTGASEWPLVIFTVLTQAAVGACLARAVLRGASCEPGQLDTVLASAVWLLLAAVLAAILHLGRPRTARLALANLGSSWLSREAALGAAFGGAVAAVLAMRQLDLGSRATREVLEIAVVLLGLALILAISRLYMLRTVPAWNTWATPAAFLGTALILGVAVAAPVQISAGVRTRTLAIALHGLGIAAAMLAAMQLLVTLVHLRALTRLGGAAAESSMIVRRRHRTVLVARVLATLLGAALLALATRRYGCQDPAVALAACALLLVAELLGRFLFYASHRRVGL